MHAYFRKQGNACERKRAVIKRVGSCRKTALTHDRSHDRVARYQLCVCVCCVCMEGYKSHRFVSQCVFKAQAQDRGYQAR